MMCKILLTLDRRAGMKISLKLHEDGNHLAVRIFAGDWLI